MKLAVAAMLLFSILCAGCIEDLPKATPDRANPEDSWTYSQTGGGTIQIVYEGEEERGGAQSYVFRTAPGQRSQGPESMVLRTSDGARLMPFLDEDATAPFVPFMHWDATDRDPYTKSRVAEGLWITTRIMDKGDYRIVNQTEYHGNPNAGDVAEVMRLRIEYPHGAIRPHELKVWFGYLEGDRLYWQGHVVETLNE